MTDMPDWDDDILGEDATDDVIELTDIVEDSSDEQDDGVIELTDIVEDDLDKTPEEPAIELDDPVIELTDKVEEDASSEVDPVLDEMGGESLDFDDDLSMEDEFSEISENKSDIEPASEPDFDPEFTSDNLELESDMVIGLPDDEPEDEPVEEDLIDDISIEEGLSAETLSRPEPVQETVVDEIPVVSAPAMEMNIGKEDVEAALDRIIEKKFADRIESMLFEAMENVIKKEIKQIKTTLLKDLDQNESD